MMRTRHITIVIILVLASTFSRAQVFEVENSVDEKYTPPEGSIFDTKAKSSNNNEYVTYDYKNAIQFNLTSVARGAAALQYERALTSNLVIMGTGGVTLFQDVIKNFLLGFVYDSDRYNFDNTADGIGIFWGGEFKGYLGEAFNDDFVSFGIRNFSYNLEWTPSTSPNPSGDLSLSDYSQKFKESNRDFYIGYGFTSVFSENLIGEFSVNAGVRRIKSSSFEPENSNDYYSYYSSTVTSIKRTDFVELVPTFFLSYKLGFAFGK